MTAVVPAMNEADNLRWVLTRLPALVDEVVLVDAHSTDESVAVAREVRPDVVVVEQWAAGKGAALRNGFEAATGDYVVMLDADGSMDPLEIHEFVAALDLGYDVVKGSRFLEGGGSADLTRSRRSGNHALCRVVDVLFLVAFTDLCYGYVAFRRDCLGALDLTATGFEIETEIAIHAVKAGLRVAEVPSFELQRRHGASHLHALGDGRRIIRTVLRERVTHRRQPVVDQLEHRALLERIPPEAWRGREVVGGPEEVFHP